MTFLAPTAMILLAGISIPVLIHFLNRMNVKKVDYSSIRFLKSMKNSTIRSVRLKKLILLFLRIGIISALVLMVSRPVTKGFMPGWLSAEMDSRLLLVIDNSSSMSALGKTESLLEEAKQTANKLLDVYSENTTVNIIQTCPPLIIFNGKTKDENIKNVINQIKPTKEFDDLWFLVDSFTTTMSIDEPLKECIIISDFQTRENFTDSLPKDWKYYFIDAGLVDNNISINNVNIVSRIKVPDQLIKIKTTINNYGLKTNNNVPINLLFEQNRVGQVISDFGGNTNKDFIFQAYPNKKGMLTGSIQLPKDDYLNDNVWYLNTPILNKINCLIISNSDQDYEIFDLIIDAIDPNNQLINLELRKQPVVNRLFVDDIDILIIHGPDAFTEAAFNELDVFLKNGGGLIWFSGGIESDISYKKYFSNLRFPNAVKTVDAENGIYNVTKPLVETHVLSDLSVRKLEEELPNVFSYVKHNADAKQKVHLELNNGDPFLIDFDRGNGKIFYFTSLLNLSWNDLTLRGLLIPLMYRLLILGGTDEVNSLPVIVGDTKWIMLKANEVRNDWEVKSPSGIKNLIVPDFIKESLKIIDTKEHGIYSVFKNKKLYTSFSTELHHSEIISKQISENEANTLFNNLEYKWIAPSNNFISVFNEIRHGKALWRLFLILAIVLFLLETYIGRPAINNMRK